MSKERYRNAITGQALKDEINAAPLERDPIVEGLIYRNSVIMVSADPGCGKSTVIACAIAQMSCGFPVFGYLNVPRPVRVYYLPFERGRQEIEERLRQINSAIPINYDNIYINDKFMGFNVIRQLHADEIVEAIRLDCKDTPPDVIVLDPIYSSVEGGLTNDEKASMFTRFSTRLQVEFNCSNWLNHHTVKEQYQEGHRVERDDPFYGSQWLKAHVTGAYYMRLADRNKPGEGVIMACKKNSHGNLISKLTLGFNPDSYTSYLKDPDITLPAIDRLKNFLRIKWKTDNKTFYFDELEGCLLGVSTSWVRALTRHPIFKDSIESLKTNGKKTLYTVTKEV